MSQAIPAGKVAPDRQVQYDGEFTNIGKNALMPVDFRITTQVGGAAFYVTAEVLVSWLLRKVIKAPAIPLKDLAIVHAMSLPLIGGMQAPMEANNSLAYEAPLTEQFMAGAKGIPGLMAAVYAHQTFLKGFHRPQLSFKDVAIMAVAKTLTRPLLSFAYGAIPDAGRNGLDVIEHLQSLQRVNSRLVSEDDPDFVATWKA
jgi:hypothetical protein